MRLRETASLLVALGLEDKEVLNTKLRTGEIEDLIVLTLLHTAYASRRYKQGLLLANGNTLQREYCPANGLSLFDKVVDLKDTINQALKLANINSKLDAIEYQLEESKVVLQWIKLIKEGKPLIAADTNATPDQLMIVNTIIEKINRLKLTATLQLSKQSEGQIHKVRI